MSFKNFDLRGRCLWQGLSGKLLVCLGLAGGCADGVDNGSAELGSGAESGTASPSSSNSADPFLPGAPTQTGGGSSAEPTNSPLAPVPTSTMHPIESAPTDTGQSAGGSTSVIPPVAVASGGMGGTDPEPGGSGGAEASAGSGGQGGASGAPIDAGPDESEVGRSEGCGQASALNNSASANMFNYNTLSSGGAERRYILRLPENYDNEHPYRLIVGFHGATNNATNVAGSPAFFGLYELAEDSTIFVAPEAVGGIWSANEDLMS